VNSRASVRSCLDPASQRNTAPGQSWPTDTGGREGPSFTRNRGRPYAFLGHAPFLEILRPYRRNDDSGQSGTQRKAGSRKHLKPLVENKSPARLSRWSGYDDSASYGQKKSTPVKAGVFRAVYLNCDYSLSEAGSERFLGDFLLRTPISSCAAGGTATAPLRTISSASSFLW
jgi:hypothetical protein